MRLWLSDKAKAQIEAMNVKAPQAATVPQAVAPADDTQATKKMIRESIKHTRQEALDSDTALSFAIAKVESAARARTEAKRDPRLAKAEKQVEDDAGKVADLRAEIEKLRVALEAAEAKLLESNDRLSAVQAEIDPAKLEAAYASAHADAKAAAVSCASAWEAVPKAFKKERRDRKLKRKAIEMGLLSVTGTAE